MMNVWYIFRCGIRLTLAGAIRVPQDPHVHGVRGDADQPLGGEQLLELRQPVPASGNEYLVLCCVYFFCCTSISFFFLGLLLARPRLYSFVGADRWLPIMGPQSFGPVSDWYTSKCGTDVTTRTT